MRDPKFQEEVGKAVERLAQMESRARSPAEAARWRDMRHRQERMAQTDGEGLLPCSECGEWGDLSSGKCPQCAQPVSIAGIIATSEPWKVHLTFAILFTGITLGCGAAAFTSRYPLLVKVPAFLVMLVAAAGMAAYWRDMLMAVIWRIRRKR
jgi:hypothetical protein